MSALKGRIPTATPLTPGDKKDIIDRRNDKAAAKTLAREFKVSEERIRKIWGDAGIRFDKDAKPDYEAAGAGDSEAAADEKKAVRSSAKGKFIAKEPPEPVAADETVGEGGDVSADSAVRPDNVADEDDDKVRGDLGTLAAGNDSEEVLEDLEERLSRMKLQGKISPSKYKEVLSEAESTYSENAESESEPEPLPLKRSHSVKQSRDFPEPESDAESSEAPDEPVRRPAPRQVRHSRPPARPHGDGRADRHGRSRPARDVQAPPVHAGKRLAAREQLRGDAPAPSRAPVRTSHFARASSPSDESVDETDGERDERISLGDAFQRAL